MTYRESLLWGEEMLKESGIADAKIDAWLLLSMACGIDRNFYYMHMRDAMGAGQQKAYEAALKKRAKRIPLQYITGEQEFMGLRFLVDASVLIPRQDTEILAGEAIKRIRPGMDVLDLCTGSGCLIISILKNIPQIHAQASDISDAALSVAKENAKRHGVAVWFVKSDLFSQIQGTFDVIVSNPPYIKTEEIAGLMPEVRDFEPYGALDGKDDGLFFYRKIIAEGKRYLKPGGTLMLEIGHGQKEAVRNLLRQAGYGKIEIVKDLAGLDRVAIGGYDV